MTSEQIEAVRVLAAIASTIAEAGPLGAPRGVLYAALMTKGVNMETYEAMERTLIRSGIVTRKGDVLHAAPMGSGR